MLNVRVDMAPKWRNAMARGWTPDIGEDLLAVIDTTLATDNWPKMLSSYQGAWQPLNPKYVKWKASRGYPTDIWRLKDRTSKALSANIAIKSSGGRNEGRTVTITKNAAGVVSADVAMLPTVAGGYFDKNNQRRRIMMVLPMVAQKAANRCVRVIQRWFQKAGLSVPVSASVSSD